MKSLLKITLLLGGVNVILFWNAFQPNKVIFSNDAPLSQHIARKSDLPGQIYSMWDDLNWLGYAGASNHYLRGPDIVIYLWPLSLSWVIGILLVAHYFQTKGNNLNVALSRSVGVSCGAMGLLLLYALLAFISGRRYPEESILGLIWPIAGHYLLWSMIVVFSLQESERRSEAKLTEDYKLGELCSSYELTNRVSGLFEPMKNKDLVKLNSLGLVDGKNLTKLGRHYFDIYHSNQ